MTAAVLPARKVWTCSCFELHRQSQPSRLSSPSPLRLAHHQSKPSKPAFAKSQMTASFPPTPWLERMPVAGSPVKKVWARFRFELLTRLLAKAHDVLLGVRALPARSQRCQAPKSSCYVFCTMRLHPRLADPRGAYLKAAVHRLRHKGMQPR